MSTLKSKADDIKNKTSDALADQQQKMKESLSNIQTQLQSSGNQINDYLQSIDAEVHDYRFVVEKIDNGISIDVAFKATMKQKVEWKISIPLPFFLSLVCPNF